MSQLIVLAGPVCAGKTTLAATLARRFDAQVLAARSVITQGSPGEDRVALQQAGQALERRTKGRWLAEAAGHLHAERLMIDAARTPDQARALLGAGNEGVLIYLAASDETCRRRYVERVDPVDLGIDFDQMASGELPLQPEMRTLADLVIETDESSIEEVAEAAERFLVNHLQQDSPRD